MRGRQTYCDTMKRTQITCGNVKPESNHEATQTKEHFLISDLYSLKNFKVMKDKEKLRTVPH